MEDSSTNPYIPRESEEVRKKVYERQSPLGRIVKWALIVTAAAIVLIGGGLFFVVPRATAVDQPARQKLADTLQPPDQTLKRVNVTSQLGFNLNYDNRVYDSYAEVGADSAAGTDQDAAIAAGQTYENNDLRVDRAYNYIRIRPSESVDTSRSLEPIPPQLEIFATVSSKDLATEAAVPENKGLSQLSLFVKLDGDQRLAKRVADDGTVVTIDETKPVSATVGGVEYQKVRYTTTNNNYRISDVSYDDCYYTIQNNQPYSVCVSNVRPQSVSAASLVENVFNSLNFTQPQTTGGGSNSSANGASTSNKVSYAYPLAILTQATPSSDTTNADAGAADANDGDGSESPLLTVTPEYYNDADSLTAIAKTQPSVVRVGTLYCADLSLKYESGDTASTLTGACAGNVASGVIISKDGYIATTGHAIRNQKAAAIGGYINFAPDQNTMMDRLNTVLTYLLNSKIILQSDADYLTTGAQIGDQEALAKIANIGSVIPDNFIVPSNEQYTYAVQPADQPIVLNTNNSAEPSFAYSDTVLQASYKGSDYDPTKSVQYVFGSAEPQTDVGLLKVSGNFQDIPIAQSMTVKSGDTLSTVGYPAYTDSTLTIDKIRNQPIVTSSKVDQVYTNNGSQLIQTDTPVLPGNDGAPVVNNQGQLVGLAVYGLSYCPDQQCFANGTVRPATELLTLLNENNINLQTGSNASKSWTKGVDQYFRANYQSAASAFGAAANLYQFNVWGSALQKLAAAAEGTTKDTSLMNTLESVMIVILVLLIVATILLAIAFYVHRRQINRLQVGHYGLAPNTPPVGAAPAPLAPAAVPQGVAPLPQLPQPQISNVQSAPQPQQPAESPIIPIREQPAVSPTPTLPGAVQPQQPPAPSQPQPPQTDEPKDSFYS